MNEKKLEDLQTQLYTLQGETRALMVAIISITDELPKDVREACVARLQKNAQFFRDVGIDKAIQEPYFEGYDDMLSTLLPK